jgi:hypothetical protein
MYVTHGSSKDSITFTFRKATTAEVEDSGAVAEVQ